MFPLLSRKLPTPHLFQCRSYAVKTPESVFQNIDLTKQRVTQISSERFQTLLPLNADWEPPSKIKLVYGPSSQMDSEAPHFYLGGLPALMQACRRLKENPSAKVVYVNDGQIPKTVQSGHHAHVHPSEWSAPECQTMRLFKTFAKGIGIIQDDNPADLDHYSYLHFPFVFKDVVKAFNDHMRIYGSFFTHRIVLNLTTKDGLSKQDHWVCDRIRESLAFHETLSSQIEKETGQPSFKKSFRVYWSGNQGALARKKKTWENVNISCDYMTTKEIREHTLLKANGQFPVLKVNGDGKFYPNCSELIISHLKKNYPQRFTYRQAKVEEILIDRHSGQPLMVTEQDCLSKKNTVTKVSSLFGSIGHDEVFRADASNTSQERLWRQVPVSGISSIWKGKISKEELKSRFGIMGLSDDQLKERVNQFVAAANLSNLHVTTWDCQIENDHIILIARATQGANFNSYVASKNDLLNMRNNFDRYFIGDWELISVGTCTRRTSVSNVPEYYKLSNDSGFILGLSGLGYSFSGAPFDKLKQS